jgi:hypothetical protein
VNNRSLLALTLVVVLGAASFVACRSENIDSGSSPTPTQAPPVVTTAAVTAAPTATTPPPRPKAKIAPFAEASKALDKRCVPKLPPNATNLDTKTAAAQTA